MTYDSRPETYEHIGVVRSLHDSTPDSDLAWAGGLFEGEGWFGLTKVGGGAYPLAGLSMVDEDVVTRFATIMGVGTVIQEKARGGARQPAWRWKVSNRPDFATAVALLEPWLGERRRRQLAETRATMSPVKLPSGPRVSA